MDKQHAKQSTHQNQLLCGLPRGFDISHPRWPRSSGSTCASMFHTPPLVSRTPGRARESGHGSPSLQPKQIFVFVTSSRGPGHPAGAPHSRRLIRPSCRRRRLARASSYRAGACPGTCPYAAYAVCPPSSWGARPGGPPPPPPSPQPAPSPVLPAWLAVP